MNFGEYTYYRFVEAGIACAVAVVAGVALWVFDRTKSKRAFMSFIPEVPRVGSYFEKDRFGDIYEVISSSDCTALLRNTTTGRENPVSLGDLHDEFTKICNDLRPKTVWRKVQSEEEVVVHSIATNDFIGTKTVTFHPVGNGAVMTTVPDWKFVSTYRRSEDKPKP